MRRRTLLLASGALAGCGGQVEDRTDAQLRLVNASSGYSQLDLRVSGRTRAAAVAYGAGADYAGVDPDDTDDTVVALPGSATALLTLNLSVAEDRHYTLLTYGASGSLTSLLLTDETDAPDRGKALLRVVNAASDAGNLDVYLTAASDAITGAVALQSAAAYGALGGFISTTAATWRLRVTAAGSKTDVRLDTTLTLASAAVTTLVLTPSAGGLLVNALLLADQGGIQRVDTAQARIRVAATAAGGSAISASVGGVQLLNGSNAPVINAGYATVAAGTVPVVVTVGGAAAPLTTTTLAAGADYTLLVAGTAGAPRAALIADDNRLPAQSTQAKLRLVHGVADLSGTLALKLDFQPLVDNVAFLTASGYVAVDAATESADFDVTTPGVADAVSTLANQTLAAGSVYSLFIAANTDPIRKTAILKKDR